MSDYVPSSTQIQALGPRRRSLRGALYVALALPGGLLVRFSRKLLAAVRWLPRSYMRVSVDGADQVRETISPGHMPSHLELDPAQVSALTAALRLAIVGGHRSIPSLAQRRADSSDSDSSGDDDEERGHPNDRHLWYPLIQSLEAGDAGLFVSGSAASLAGLTDATLPPGLYRLSDVHENPLILTASAESFSGPCELTDETTRTWVIRLKITTKLVCLSKRQLHEQNQELAEECFAEVAEQSLEQILEVACSFSDAGWSDVHISQQLTVFDALVDVLFNIQDLRFSGSGGCWHY